MPLDPRTPVLVGGGQLSNRVDEGADALEPVDLIVAAARRAADDTGAADPAKVLAALDSVRVVHLLSWHQRDPGRLVADRVGATDLRHAMYTTPGGNTPQALVNRTCLDILRGRVDVALVGGAEAWRTRMATRAAGGRPAWTVEPEDAEPDEVFGAEHDMRQMVHPLELARGVVMPVQIYPVFESALRAQAGATHDEWAAHLGRLWSRFSEVAASNPHAWIQEAYSPEDVVTPSADNRMIGFPYPKRVNSNNAVEQGAALLLCSAEAAERLRADAGSTGLITANGGYLTKHAFGVYSTTPPPRGRFVHRDCQAEVDDVGSVELVADHEGAVRIEGATVMHDRDGKPETAYLATRTPDRHRAWATSTDDDVMALVTEDEPVGVAAHRGADGTLSL